VTGLIADVDEWETSAEVPGTEKLSDWEKTSLKPYIQYFKGYVARITRDEMRVKNEKEELKDLARVEKMLDF